MADEAVLKEGWLTKQGGRYKSWKKRYFALRESRLVYYKDNKKKEVLGEVSFHTITSVEESDFKDPKNKKRWFFRINVSTERTSYLIGADTAQDCEDWMIALREAHGNYVHQLKTQRRATHLPPEKQPSSPATGRLAASTDVVKRKPILLETRADSAKTLASMPSGSGPSSPVASGSSTAAAAAAAASSSTGSSSSRGNIVARADDATEASLQRSFAKFIADTTEATTLENAKELYASVVGGSAGAVKARLQMGVSPGWRNDEEGGRTALHVAAIAGDARILELLLQFSTSSVVNARDAREWTPLMEAAHKGHIDCTKLLLQRGADINARDRLGLTATHIACIAGRSQLATYLIATTTANEEDDDWSELHIAAITSNITNIRELLAQGEELTPHPENLLTPLHLAACSGSRECVTSLLEHGAHHTMAVDLLKKSPMHYAVASGNLGCVTALLEKGVHIDAPDHYKKTPLMMAIGLGHNEVSSLLIERSCSLVAADSFGFTPLHYASLHGRIETVKLLLEQPTVQIDALADNGITPLYLAAHAGHVAIVNLLILKGANQSLTTVTGLTPMHEAARNGNSKCISLLLTMAAPIDTQDDLGNTPLFYACKSNSRECASMLLDAKADPDHANKRNETILAVSLEHDNFDLVDALLEKGASVNKASTGGQSPLFIAATHGHKEIVELLLQCGADVHFKHRWQLTPLIRAVTNGHASVAATLLAWNADPNHRTTTGWSAMQEAAALNRADCIHILLEYDADTNVANDQGVTPLHEAATNGHLTCVQSLLLNGANPNQKDNEGFTPLQRAAFHGKVDCALVLLSAGAIISDRSRRMMGALIGTLCDAKLNEQESQVVDKMDTVGQLKEELAAAQAALAEKDATLASKEATLQQLSRESSAANEQLSSMKQESTTLRKQSQALEDENRRIKLELEALRQQQQLLQQQQQQQQQSFLAQQQQYQLLLQQQQTGGVAAAAALISPTKDSSPEGAATAPGASATNPSIVATANTPTLTRLGSGTMSAEDQAIVARNYLKQVQQLLSADEYKNFQALLRDYKKKNMQIEELIERIRVLFSTKETLPLLQGFITFVPAKCKQQYAEFCAKMEQTATAAASATSTTDATPPQ